MDIDNIDIEEDIYECSNMNNIYNGMLKELDQKVIELATINDKINYINDLRIQKTRINNKINKEKKKWITRESLIILILMPFLFVVNPIIISLLILITAMISNQIYREKTKDFHSIAMETLPDDNYQELITQKNIINNELTRLRREIHAYKKQINNLMKDIDFVKQEFYGYDQIIQKLNAKKSDNDENYSYILKKY